MKRRAISLILSLILTATTSVFASETLSFDEWVHVGKTITLNDKDTLDLSNLSENGDTNIIIEKDANVKIFGNKKVVFQNLNVFCEENVNLTIKDLKFSTKKLSTPYSKTMQGGIYFSEGEKNVLTLIGDNLIEVVENDELLKNHGAGVGISEDADLIINASESNVIPSLTVTSENGGAGIGGGYQSQVGNISIEGVKIDATGAGAGIGGGVGKVSGGHVSSITIKNAEIVAKGLNGAGIGGGAGVQVSRYELHDYSSSVVGGNVENIDISDSKISAVGEFGAGIGGGAGIAHDATGNTVNGGGFALINIANSEIDANGKKGAGIGGGLAFGGGWYKSGGDNASNSTGGGILPSRPETGVIIIKNAGKSLSAKGDIGAGIGGGGAYSSGTSSRAFGGTVSNISISGQSITANSTIGASIGGGGAHSEGFDEAYAMGGEIFKLNIADASIYAGITNVGAILGGGGSVIKTTKTAHGYGGNSGVSIISSSVINAKMLKTSISNPLNSAIVGGGSSYINNAAYSPLSEGTGGNNGETLVEKSTLISNFDYSRSLAPAIGGGGIFAEYKDKKQVGGFGGNIVILPMTTFNTSTGSKTSMLGGGKSNFTGLSNNFQTNLVIVTDNLPNTFTGDLKMTKSSKAFKSNEKHELINTFKPSNLPKTFSLGHSVQQRTYVIKTFGASSPASK